jgi:hypothetical protein
MDYRRCAASVIQPLKDALYQIIDLVGKRKPSQARIRRKKAKK